MFPFPNFSQNDVQIAHDTAHCYFEPLYKVIIFLYHDTRGTYWYHGSGIIILMNVFDKLLVEDITICFSSLY